MVKVDVVLITGRTSEQGVGLEIGKGSEEYFESVAVVGLNPSDIAALQIDEGDPVEISTTNGSVVVRSLISEGLDPGKAFMPYGPWANQVLGSYSGGTGMPSLRNIEATVKPSAGRKVPSLEELAAVLRRRSR